MLKEIKGLEYTLEILRVLDTNPAEIDSKEVYRLISEDNRLTASLSYVQKILPRMVKANLINSSDSGYVLNRPVKEITIDMVLDMCEFPRKVDLLYQLCNKLKSSVSLSNITEIYNF